MSDFDNTHDAPQGRWRRSHLIKTSREDTCYGPDCDGRRRPTGSAHTFTATAITPITASIGPYASIITTLKGGTGPYTYAIFSGALPPNLSINASTGNISGTLTVASLGTFTFAIQVTDATARKAVTNVVTFTVSAVLWDTAIWNTSNWQ